ncbi:MAG: GNAT family N-acetyltransferase [Nocardioides sp.]
MTRLLDRHRVRLPSVPARVPAQPGATAKGIRRRRPKDLGACGRLLEVVHYDAHYPVIRPEPPRAWLDDESVLDAWVAERLGEILGHVAISSVGRDAVSALRWRETTERDPSELVAVSRFFVRPRVRGEGIGTSLLDAAVAEIRGRNCLQVLEMLSPRRDGIPFLARRGWRLVAQDPWASNKDVLFLYRYTAPRQTDAR